MSIFLRAVPAIEPLIPEFAINPNATDTSCTLNPKAPATGAMYLNDSPSIDTFVFEFDAAAASTSANIVESFAFKLNAVKASVTISEVLASSSPDAAARFIIPSTPLSISSVFQPAIAMYSIAFPASVAENWVLIPISLAFSPSLSIAVSLDPEIAWTVLI